MEHRPAGTANKDEAEQMLAALQRPKDRKAIRAKVCHQTIAVHQPNLIPPGWPGDPLDKSSRQEIYCARSR